jgi:DNA-binding transcriptional LysR family regulator
MYDSVKRPYIDLGDTMEKKELEAFTALSQSKTVSEACSKTGLAENELKEIIGRLEDKLGYPVISRVDANVELTQFGKILRNNAERIILDLNQVESAMQRAAGKTEGRIRFGCFTTAHSFVLLGQIANAFPDIDFRTTVCAIRGILTGLAQDKLDIAILPETAVPDGYLSLPVYDEQAYLSVPYNSSLADKQSVSLDDIAHEPIALAADIHGQSQWYESIFKASGGEGARVQHPDMPAFFAGMQDTPLSYFSSSLMELFGVANSGRAELPIDADVAHRKIVLAYPKDKKSKLEPVLDFVAQNKDALYTCSAFIPYLMHPGRIHNLDASRES